MMVQFQFAKWHRLNQGTIRFGAVGEEGDTGDVATAAQNLGSKWLSVNFHQNLGRRPLRKGPRREASWSCRASVRAAVK